MSELNVRIVKLEPMRVVSTYGFGPGPEGIAWTKMRAWLEQKGLMGELASHRFFGFNNPSPSPASPNYGYEQWMTVGPDAQAEGDARIVQFAGGLYAVTSCKLRVITPTWMSLVAWREGSHYKPAHHQWLEEELTPFAPGEVEDYDFDIYLPIAE
jgi:DNA gyrase inhibitor GyrI